eukprot:COSAG01_NODE_6614_length_3581_cov_1.071018_3_plen_85_part_00
MIKTQPILDGNVGGTQSTMIMSSIICASAATQHLRLQVLDAVLERGEHIHDASSARLRCCGFWFVGPPPFLIGRSEAGVGRSWG